MEEANSQLKYHLSSFSKVVDYCHGSRYKLLKYLPALFSREEYPQTNGKLGILCACH
jgi:hypothetical protein